MHLAAKIISSNHEWPLYLRSVVEKERLRLIVYRDRVFDLDLPQRHLHYYLSPYGRSRRTTESSELFASEQAVWSLHLYVSEALPIVCAGNAAYRSALTDFANRRPTRG